MLKATYIHAPGVGPATERSLWTQGATTWQAFRDLGTEIKVPTKHLAALRKTVEDSVAAFEEGRTDYFAAQLPKSEHWRAIEAFPRIGFLDIETDGGYGNDSVTVIGLYDGYDMHTYVKGDNLAQFAYECQDYDGFVTFFGTGFDLPFLKRRFPVLENVFAERFHIDLCPALKKLGHRGGLKKIERDLKIVRVPETEGLSGMDAVRLWRIYRQGGRGADEALELLLSYNKEDVINMKALLEYTVPRLLHLTGFSEATVTSQP